MTHLCLLLVLCSQFTTCDVCFAKRIVCIWSYGVEIPPIEFINAHADLKTLKANYWTDIGFLYGYSTSDCSSETLGKLPTSESTCWSVDDFNGEGWGQVVRGIKLDVIE